MKYTIRPIEERDNGAVEAIIRAAAPDLRFVMPEVGATVRYARE